jgi:hypothetical protein
LNNLDASRINSGAPTSAVITPVASSWGDQRTGGDIRQQQQ